MRRSLVKTYRWEMDKDREAIDLAEHYYHLAVETRTWTYGWEMDKAKARLWAVLPHCGGDHYDYEVEPCQNLRLGNGHDLWGGYQLSGA